jgi:hypothetical protein
VNNEAVEIVFKKYEERLTGTKKSRICEVDFCQKVPRINAVFRKILKLVLRRF